MTYVRVDNAMPDVEDIQAANDAVIAASHTAEQTNADMSQLKVLMQEQMEVMPFRFAIGGAIVFFLIYWLFIRR